MGANMADVTIAASTIAGGNSVSRSSDANTRSRADALRQSPSSGSDNLAFTKQVATAGGAEVATQSAAEEPGTEEPGNGSLSTSIQLILAETRTRDDQSTFADKSILGKALTSYTSVQASVRETISLAKITASATAPRIGETA